MRKSLPRLTLPDGPLSPLLYGLLGVLLAGGVFLLLGILLRFVWDDFVIVAFPAVHAIGLKGGIAMGVGCLILYGGVLLAKETQ